MGESTSVVAGIGRGHRSAGATGPGSKPEDGEAGTSPAGDTGPRLESEEGEGGCRSARHPGHTPHGSRGTESDRGLRWGGVAARVGGTGLGLMTVLGSGGAFGCGSVLWSASGGQEVRVPLPSPRLEGAIKGLFR